MEITFNEKSNNYIDESPLFNVNENFENTTWFVDNSFEEGLSIKKNKTSIKEININLKEKEEFLEDEFQNQIEKMRKNRQEEEIKDFIYNNIFNLVR